MFIHFILFNEDSSTNSSSKAVSDSELLGRYIFLVDEKNDRNGVHKISTKENKKSRFVDEAQMFRSKSGPNEAGLFNFHYLELDEYKFTIS